MTLILTLALVLPFLASLLTYAIFCYEEANQTGQTLGDLLPDVLPALFRGGLSALLAALAYPLGLRRSLWKEPSSGQPLVILVHGLFQNPSAWILFRAWLHRQGYAVACFGYVSWKTDLDTVEENLAGYLREIMQTRPGQPIHLVGHSMGGLLLRGALARLDTPAAIQTLVTWGTPWLGSKLAPFTFSSLGRFLQFNSQALHEMAARPFPAHIRVLALSSPVDNMVLPKAALRCTIAGCTEKTTLPISHMDMLYSWRVFRETLNWIRGL